MKPNYSARLETLRDAWEAFKDQDFRDMEMSLMAFPGIDSMIASFANEDLFLPVTYDAGEYIIMPTDKDATDAPNP